MANKTYGRRVRGLRDLKITNAAGTVQEDLDAAVLFQFSPELEEALLEGDDVVKERFSTVIGGTGRLTTGGYSSAAVAIMLGKTLTVASSSPTETTSLKVYVGDVMPSFKIYGIGRDKNGGAMQVLLGNCTVTSLGDWKLENKEYFISDIEVGLAGDESTGLLFEVIQQETAGNLPTS